MRKSFLVTLLLATAALAADTPAPESGFFVGFNKKTITVAPPSGASRTIAWKDLTQVAVRTSDEGPKKPALFWELHGTNDVGTVVFPGGATGENALVEAMQVHLKGFDSKKLVDAMNSNENATFVLWNATPK